MNGRILLFLVFLVFSSSLLWSQGSPVFIVMNVTGTVNYVERPGAVQSSLVSGQTLGAEAVVSVTPGSSVRLLYGDQSHSLTVAGNYPLKSLVAKKTERSSSFLERFFNYVYEGIINTSGSKKIEEYHEFFLTQSSGGIKGFAGGEYGIALARPVAGNIAEDLVGFEWFSSGDSTLYDFQVADFQTDGLLFKALLRDTSISLDFGKLAVEPGRKYYWVVQRKHLGEMAIGFPLADDPSMRSPKTEFIVSSDGNAELIRSIETATEYLEAGETDRLLMAAQTLEESRYIYEADHFLRKALEKAPGDPLLKRIYGAFLVRHGLWQAAQMYLNIP